MGRRGLPVWRPVIRSCLGALGPGGCAALNALNLALPGQRVVEEDGSLERVHRDETSGDFSAESLVVEDGEREEEVEGAENGEELLAEEGTFVVNHGRQLGAGGGEHEEAEELHQEEGGRGPAKVRHEFVVAGDGKDGTRREDVASAHDEHHRVARDGDSLDVLGRGHF